MIAYTCNRAWDCLYACSSALPFAPCACVTYPYPCAYAFSSPLSLPSSASCHSLSPYALSLLSLTPYTLFSHSSSPYILSLFSTQYHDSLQNTITQNTPLPYETTPPLKYRLTDVANKAQFSSEQHTKEE